MQFLCVLCSMGGAVAFLAVLVFAAVAKTVDGLTGDRLLVAMAILFIAGVGSCAAEERVCEIAGLEADP